MCIPGRRTAALAGAIVLAVTGPTAPRLAHSTPAQTVTDRWDPSRSVTLLTGDTVYLGPSGQPEVRTGPGRRDISYAVQRVGGRLSVVPSDAADLLSQGKLDPRLFDVRGLLADGLDDQHSKDVRLLIEQSEPVGQLRSINASPVKIAKAQAAATWATLVKGQRLQGAVDKIWLDGRRKLSLDRSVPQIGAPEAWKSGKGVKVAVVDSGIDANHPDLSGQVIASENFTAGPAGDRVGHGTHVASTIAGTGAASGGKYRGVAPDAQLLDAQVCAYSCFDSDVLAGMEWAVAQGADVVNLSLGGQDDPAVDPLEEAVNRLSSWALFVVAAGNHPYCTSPRYGVASPATADAALAVGAVDRSDAFADFSCAGPRLADHAIKPDISAPGVDIVAARAKDGVSGEPVDDHYSRMSGTSMATPHIAGAAAIMTQQHPDWAPARIKSALMSAAKPHRDQTVFQQGAGRVDVAAAVKQTVVPDQGSLSYPVQLFPHSDDTPVAKTITYSNTGTADADLTLAVDATGPDGRPAGTFSVSRSSVRIPAGGSAQITVTADTSLDGPDGFSTGRVIATVGSSRLVTALAVEREAESYNLTIKHVDRAGEPMRATETVVASTDDPAVFDFVYQPSSVVRLPKGRYVLSSYLRLEASSEIEDRAFLAVPELDLNKDSTLTLDAAKAKPVTVEAPQPGAAPTTIVLGFAHRSGLAFSYYTGEDFEGLNTGPIGPGAAADDFASTVLTQWCEQDEPMICVSSPYQYLLQWYVPGKLYTGFEKTVQRQELATVRSTFAATSANQRAEMVWLTQPTADLPELPSGVTLFPQLPSQSTVYLQPEGTRWFRQFRETRRDPESGETVSVTELGASPRTYRAGTTTVEDWNRGAFGPGFPATDRRPFAPAAKPWAGRTGDHLRTDLPLFTDGSGHAGFSPADRSRTTLKQGGKVIAEATTAAGVLAADLPAGTARYSLEAEAKRNSQNSLASEVSATWTFDSGHTRTETALPLSAVRFTPVLDDHNRAEAGWVPVHVERQPGSAAQPTKTLAVKVSYDEGKTWQTTSLRQGATGLQVRISPPDDAAYVSLQARSTDTAGNTVDQTVLRAFATTAR